jgi:hypothetical protein
MREDIQSRIFFVCDEPHCAWGWDLAERNLAFLDGIDEGYFEYIARTHHQHLEGEHAQRAAVALRANYHLCLETLFGLIGAALQAPDCAVGWVLKCSTTQLRTLTEALFRDTMGFPVQWEPVPSGFDVVAELVMRNTAWASQDGDTTTDRFAILWSRLAQDFLDPNAIAEHNSIKHGFRARAGGFTIRIGFEREYGVTPPEKEMKSMGGSVFGTSFYAAEAIKDAPKVKRDPHFTLRRHALNWLPDDTAGRMLLAALSIKNVRSFLSVTNGRPPGEVVFVRPEDAEDFDRPWECSTGVTHTSIDRTVNEGHIHRASRDALRQSAGSPSSKGGETG